MLSSPAQSSGLSSQRPLPPLSISSLVCSAPARPRLRPRLHPHVSRACERCRIDHRSCDAARPCRRCVAAAYPCKESQRGTGTKDKKIRWSYVQTLAAGSSISIHDDNGQPLAAASSSTPPRSSLSSSSSETPAPPKQHHSTALLLPPPVPSALLRDSPAGAHFFRLYAGFASAFGNCSPADGTPFPLYLSGSLCCPDG